ncbi:PEP/pyruvate-binding domain-containing protein [Hymenobacter metallilatus]|uniref:Phosphoenolpyruvate synthase n=1 Tax=Hymenobacter metallilatus TaxID=2493666 RepID=A0A428JPZ1_9BACT|nr:PEP/pyruvate-binding domain-containing protein [Hymenobacter metallilatus]RSK35398.1 phosphoenolpyruvate synthase [Hymenobacter metallilatus]
MILHGSTPPAHHTIGHKARGLFRLQAAGLPLPEFLVLPAETFDAALLPGADAARQREQLRQFPLSTADQEAIRRQLVAWGFPGRPVVVRSSVADEDGAGASFAGLMDSFLNLTTEAAVWDAIGRCAASAYSERALAYRRQKQLPLAARPAVLVQRQVAAEASGVVFSTFPEYPQEMAIHAVWGFGEGLVSGQLEPDEFYLDKQTGATCHTKLAVKETQFQPAPGGEGLHLAAVPAARQQAACLPENQLAELFAVARRLEKEFGGPQDVEFVVEAGRLWLVQARPITQPIPEVILYDNSNIQESYCGVTTPLTFSFAQRAYATVYRQTMWVLGLPAARVAAHETTVTNLLGLVRGRIYYNINNWYRGLQLLPSFRQNKADMERMMGLEEPVDFVMSRRKSVFEALRLLPGLALNLQRLLRAFGQLDARVPAFQAHFATEYRRFYAQPLASLGGMELVQEKTRLDEVLLQRWTTPIINDFLVMTTNGRVGRGLQRLGIAQPEEFLSRYLSGDQQVASTQPTRHLQALARQAWAHPQLRELLLTSTPDLHAQVACLAPGFHEAVQEFIGQYGDRTVGELKLETTTMRVEPAVFYQYLRNFLLAPPTPETPDTSSPLQQQARQELAQRLSRRNPWFRWRLRQQLERLQQAIRYREALRLERTRLFGMYRALYRAMGMQLAQQGRLTAAEDVFWLTGTELLAAVAGSPTDLLPLVAQRHCEFREYARQDVPSRVTVPARPAPVPVPAGALVGTGCYPGVVEGEIVVITDPGDDLAVSGKIVCALRTDPGWAALFPMCRGVIIEKGSSLSHSVILLRELGIPTIINVPHLTQRLRSGQRLRLNGTTGEIEELPTDSVALPATAAETLAAF